MLMSKGKLALLAAAFAAFAVPAAALADRAPVLAHGAVFAITNATTGNGVAMFARGVDGSLTYAGTVATGGTGTVSSEAGMEGGGS